MTLDRLITQLMRETDYANNRYLTSVASGDMGKDDFIETQIQFYFAVVFFSRPMAALAAKIPHPKLRVEILRNVWEEHGEGDPARMHGATFVEFLSRLTGFDGARMAAEIERRALWPEVRVFNTTLMGACVLEDYLIGTAMLGMIERMFCDISRWLGKGVVERGWLQADRMIHYNLHEKLDIKHAGDFFEVLTPAWQAGADNRYYVEQGLRLGAYVFNGLYEGLYRARAQRLLRETAGPHSRTDISFLV
jgi:pyrroloquinoline-quinone synthase